jgi:hypothetical protein
MQTKLRTRLPEDFRVTTEVMVQAREHGWPDPRKELEAFKDYHLAKGTLNLDWEAAFRTWLRRAVTMDRKYKPIQPPITQPPSVKPAEARPEDTSKVRDLVLNLAEKFNVRKKA